MDHNKPHVRDEWHIVTSEYPPATGGVSDYTRVLAEGLAAAGETVHVWCPSAEGAASIESAGVDVVVHRELGRFAPKDLRRVGKLLDAQAQPRRLLVQYVPHGYGWRAMNLWLCLWLWRRARTKGDRVELMVHEPFLHLREGGLRQKAAALVQRVMAVVLLRAASRVGVSTPAWGEALRPFALGRRIEFEWLPVPSTIEVADDDAAADAVRRRYARETNTHIVGHLGTYPRHTVEQLKQIVPRLLAQSGGATMLLIGRGSEAARDEVLGGDAHLAARVRATGELAARELSAHLAACDLILLPFPDGVTTRRTSAMAALAHGVAVVTTRGRLTETLWDESRAVKLVAAGDTVAMCEAVVRLLEDGAERTRLSAERAFYRERFDVSHTIMALRCGPESASEARSHVSELKV